MIIKDAIYGFIHINDLCKIFIDTPEFQRLRRIKQLGLAYYVYPGAVHTRFEHCLGVMYLAGKVADKLAFFISPREKELLQLAGLLHDVGHVAFSHLMDYILEEKKINSELVPLEQDLWVKLSHHEERSIYILKQINSRCNILSVREVEMVSKMIKGDTTGESKPFLFEIVNNKTFGVDVDRLDYLQRDMYHTGSPCFQAHYILECIGLDNNCLAIRKKALPEIEMMYESRKRLFMLICRHKTVMRVEAVMREAVSKVVETVGESIETWFSGNWLKLDDYRMYCLIEDTCPELLEKLHTRNLPEVDSEARLVHIKYIDRESIDEQIKNVRWIK